MVVLIIKKQTPQKRKRNKIQFVEPLEVHQDRKEGFPHHKNGMEITHFPIIM